MVEQLKTLLIVFVGSALFGELLTIKQIISILFTTAGWLIYVYITYRIKELQKSQQQSLINNKREVVIGIAEYYPEQIKIFENENCDSRLRVFTKRQNHPFSPYKLRENAIKGNFYSRTTSKNNFLIIKMAF